MVHFVGTEFELLDVLVSGLLVDDTSISIDNVTLNLMAEHTFNRCHVELASSLSDDLGDLRIRVPWLK